MTTAAPTIRSNSPTARAAQRFFMRTSSIVGLCILLFLVAVILAAPLLKINPNAIDLRALSKGPSMAHLFGTDGLGRDVLARVIEGGRISLLVATVSTLISTILGFVIGAVAPLGGKWTDNLVMRFVDLVMTLPPVILLLVLASITGAGIGSTIFVISLLSWPILARLIRSRLLELRERDFVLYAQGAGAGTFHLVFRHGLPNTLDIIVVYAMLQVANAVLLEAGLSFLGLGVPQPAASWGNMLYAARSTQVLQEYPWQWLFPGAAIVLAVVAINLVGDGLRDAFDPRAE
jgi:peptide/nickel transport system permease protein